MADKHITIPCKTYVKKFIYSRYGYPFRINNHSLPGIFICGLLEKKMYDNRHHELDSNFITKHYNDKLEMVVSDFIFFRIGYDIAPDKALAFNRFLEEILEEHLFMYCDAYVRQGKQRAEAINEFAEQYGIVLEFDISFESLKKSEYRLRKKREKKAAEMEKAGLFTSK